MITYQRCINKYLKKQTSDVYILLEQLKNVNSISAAKNCRTVINLQVEQSLLASKFQAMKQFQSGEHAVNMSHSIRYAY